MARRTIGILMNGVTGRMGTNQHLARYVIEVVYAGYLSAAEGRRVELG